MEVIPSIDLREGKVVRLLQGDYDAQTIYSTDPVAVALDFEKARPSRIHVVDLDGAFHGSPQQMDLLRSLLGALTTPLQFGGGIRSIKDAKAVLDMGVDRVVFGTAAIEDPTMVRESVAVFGPQRIVVGLDARDGMVSIKGWRETGNVTAHELLALMAELGVGRFLYTDISRDGTMSTPNFEAVASISKRSQGLFVNGWGQEVKIIASGGIGSVADLEQLMAIGIEGVIIGSALYQGAVDLAAAITAGLES